MFCRLIHALLFRGHFWISKWKCAGYLPIYFISTVAWDMCILVSYTTIFNILPWKAELHSVVCSVVILLQWNAFAGLRHFCCPTISVITNDNQHNLVCRFGLKKQRTCWLRRWELQRRNLIFWWEKLRRQSWRSSGSSSLLLRFVQLQFSLLPNNCHY